MSIETSISPAELDQYFKTVMAGEILGDKEKERKPLSFALRPFDFCISAGSEEFPQENRERDIAFINGCLVPLPNEEILIIGRVGSPGEHWPDFHEIKSRQEAVRIREENLSSLREDFHNLDHFEIIKNPGKSVEDVRVTSLPDGRKVAVGVIYGGLVKRGNNEVHDVSLGINILPTEEGRSIELKPILEPGFKNGVFLDTNQRNESFLLCRSMEEPKKISVAKTEKEELIDGWKVIGELPGFWENFPQDLKNQVIRVGPGTNPVYMKELGSWVMGFHWVMKTKDIQRPGKLAEYYIGGLMFLDSIAPPHVKFIDPWGISPISGIEHHGLFEDLAENKYIAFPEGANRCKIDGEDYLVMTYGSQDRVLSCAGETVRNLTERYKDQIQETVM